MSDSEDGLLFGNITDADAEPSHESNDNKTTNNNNNNKSRGTSYPQHLTTVAQDSDSDESSADDLHRINSSHSNSAVQIKRKKSLKRDKSRKRIKDIDYKSPQINTTTITNNNNAGEEQHDDEHTDHDNDEEMVEIDPSSPIHSNNNIQIGSSTKRKKSSKTGFLNGKSHKNHQKISDKDSDDDYDEDEDEEDEDGSTPTPKYNESFGDQMKYIFHKLRKNGHLPSMVLTIIVFITLLGCFSGHWAAILIFAIFYVIYIMECYFNKSWKELDNKETADATVKLLGIFLYIS